MEKNHETTENASVELFEERTGSKSKIHFNHPDINRVFVAGTLMHDPPLRRTRKGVPVTNFIVITKPESIAQDGLEREPAYISVVVWAKQAIQCAKHLKKGSSVIVLGELQSMPNAKPQDGFYPTQISAQWIQYLERGKFSKISIIEDDDQIEEE